MRQWLAALAFLLLAGVAAAQPEPATPAAAASAELDRTLALLEEADPQNLPVEQRQSLYLALADALLNDGQQERALDFLGQARSASPAAAIDVQLRPRLQRVDSGLLLAALHAGTPLAVLIQAELARRGGAASEPAIGVLLPLSGRYAPFGTSVRQGLELARAAMPASVPGRFVYYDTAGDAATAARLVVELAARPELLAAIGPLTNAEAAPAAAQAEQEQLPLLLLAPHEGATGGQVFRFALTAAAQARALADYADRLGLQRFAILHPANRAGELFAELFQTAVEGQGGEVVARRSYPPAAFDLRVELEGLAADARQGGSGAEALFLPDDAHQVAQIIPQLGFSRLDQLQLLGTSTWNDPELVRLAGPQSEGAVFVDGFYADSPWPDVRDFVARFQAAHAIPPTLLAAQGYDAGRLLLSLLAGSAGRDRQTLRQALATGFAFPGATGRIRFGPQGEAERTLFLLQIQDGSVVQIN